MQTAKVVVLGESLLAREVRDVFSEQAPDIELKTAGVLENEAVLTGRAGEPELIMGVNEETLASYDAIILAGPAAASQKVLEMLSRARGETPALIDLTYALEDQPRARLRAPLAESGSVNGDADGVYVIAHPAAIVLTSFFRSLRARFPVRRWLAHIFEPASERGRAGINELQQQTVAMFSFQPLPKQVFDEQLTFNMLTRYGSDAPDSLETVESRIERHLASLLANDGLMPMPSLRLIQAPVFHGYSISLWVELEENARTGPLTAALAAAGIEVRDSSEEAPTNVGVVGQSGMIVGLIEPDRNDPHCAWFWVVADNQTTLAENALALVRQILGSEEA